jgi:LAO/AO transport system kinase
VSSVPPPSGIEELAGALERHRASLNLEERRLRARRLSALREFTAEHGERALRALGGRREAERRLSDQGSGASVTELTRTLEQGAAV